MNWLVEVHLENAREHGGDDELTLILQMMIRSQFLVSGLRKRCHRLSQRVLTCRRRQVWQERVTSMVLATSMHIITVVLTASVWLPTRKNPMLYDCCNFLLELQIMWYLPISCYAISARYIWVPLLLFFYIILPQIFLKLCFQVPIKFQNNIQCIAHVAKKGPAPFLSRRS